MSFMWVQAPAAPLLAILGTLAGPALAEPVPAEPMLLVETGMHMAPIRSIALDRNGRYLVTGSTDKTVRIWDLAAKGGLLRTLRPPIGPGMEGAIYAVALSPDGRVVAAGGATGLLWDGKASIYLFDRGSGVMLRRIGGLPHTISHLAFSMDGVLLAAGLGRGGVRVFRAESGDEVQQLQNCGDDSPWAEFDSAGRLVTACRDGAVRLYDRSLSRKAEWTAPEGKLPHSARFTPDGKKIAVGYENSPQVDVLSGEDLHLLYRPDAKGADRALGAVAWSRDGALLYATGDWEKAGSHPIRRWDAARALADLPGSRDRIEDLAALPGSQIAYGSQGPDWGIVSEPGKPVRSRGTHVADFRGLGSGLRLDSTGTRVLFAYQRGGQARALFSISEHKLIYEPGPDPTLRTPRAASLLPDMEPHPGPLSTDITDDQQTLVVGSESALRCFALISGQRGQQRWEVPLPAAAHAVTFSADGRLVVAALGDGTLRWYRAGDGTELLALLLHADRKRWTLFTPAGYYDAPKDSEDLLGWQQNHGAAEEADFFRASLFRERLRQPDEIAQVLRSLRKEDTPAKTKPALPVALLPPVVYILSPSDGAQTDRSDMQLRAAVRSPSGEPVSVQVLINGEPVANRNISTEQPEPSSIRLRPGETPYSIPVSIPAEDSTLAVVAQTALAKSEPALVHLRWSGKVSPVPHKLYVLAIGVGKYPKKELRLEYSAKDAKDLVDEFSKQKGKLFREVVPQLLTDKDATRARILQGLKWLQERPSPNDVAVLFLAGHGITLPGTEDYYYLPYDADPDAISQMISGDEIQNTLKNTPGKRLLFLDTCHAGNVLKPGLFRGKADLTPSIDEIFSAENGFVVFAASTGKQSSKESPVWRNGAFTRALVEGLRGRAAIDETRRITVNMLDLYLSEQVKRLTDRLQTPTMTKSKLLPDFPVAIGAVKPLALPFYALPTPLYKRWWLWTAVGVVGAGAAAGIAAGVTRRPSIPDLPDRLMPFSSGGMK